MRDDRNDMTAEDHRSQARILDTALHETSDYARHLWNDLAAVRQYLHDSLPAEPSNADEAARGASPVGPADEQGWQHWIDAYAEVTSVLCGPRGDNGHGRSSATLLARSRRMVTVPVVVRRDANSESAALPSMNPAEQPTSEPVAPAEPAAGFPTHDTPGERNSRNCMDASAVLSPLLYAAAGALGTMLALRKRLRRGI